MPTFADVFQTLENNDKAVQDYQVDLRRFLQSAARELNRRSLEEVGASIQLDPVNEAGVSFGNLLFTLRPQGQVWVGYGAVHGIKVVCQGRIRQTADRNFLVSFFSQEEQPIANEAEFATTYLEAFIKYSDAQRTLNTGQ